MRRRLEDSGGSRPGLRGRCAIVVAVLASLACAGHGLGGERPASVATLEADIALPAGAGGLGPRFRLRGTTLTLWLPIADDGAAAGQFRLELAPNHPLFAALASLPTSVAGPPPRPGMAVVSFTLRDSAGKGTARRLLVSRPTSDPAVNKALAELDRCRQTARPTMALSLEVVPPAGTARPGQPQVVIVRVQGQGVPGAQVRLDPQVVSLQVADVPATPTPGVTPLPPTWERASEPVATPPRQLEAGATVELALSVSRPVPGPRMVRAVLDGTLAFRIGDGTEELRASLSSKASPLPGSARAASTR